MRSVLLCFLFSVWACWLNAQTPLTTAEVAAAEKWLDVSFTQAERDSLLSEVTDYLAVIKAIHERPLANQVPMALRFDPDPMGVYRAQKRDSKRKVADAFPLSKAVNMPSDAQALAYYSVKDLASLIFYRKITSVALTRFFIERLKRFDDTLHCVVTLTEEIALREAAQADRDLAEGRYKGRLHGIPYGLKDLFAVKGTRTTWGAAPYQTQTIDEDAAVVQRLRAAGAVLVAKLSLGSLAMGDVWYGGITRNPWDMKQGSSGSSAGSAAAVSAGLVPFAIGTETQGSIVSPSTRCGTTGLRPTFGRVNRAGGMTLSWSMDKAGPIVRSAEDAALVFSYLHGGSAAGDASTVTVPFAYKPLKDLKTMRIGYAKNLFDALAKDRNEHNTLATFQQLGAVLVPFEWKTNSPSRLSEVILMSEAAAAFDVLTRTNLDDQLTGQRKWDWPNSFRGARYIPAVEYVNANRMRTQLIAEVNELLKDFDCVLMPSFGGAILPITNLTGHPAVVLPNGFQNERPTSITLLGNLYDEAVLLAVAHYFQQATDFDDQHPSFFKH